MAMIGSVRQARCGEAGKGRISRSRGWIGRLGGVRTSSVMFGSELQAWWGRVIRGGVRPGVARQVWSGKEELRQVRYGRKG
jgi:hypothetical protein